jgi:hypothetical protein
VWRTLAGTSIIVHGLVHAWVVARAGTPGPWWIATPLASLAAVGFGASGLGVLGLAALRDWWPGVLAAATFASLAFLIVFGRPVWIGGLIVDIVILTALIRRARQSFPV